MHLPSTLILLLCSLLASPLRALPSLFHTEKPAAGTCAEKVLGLSAAEVTSDIRLTPDLKEGLRRCLLGEDVLSLKLLLALRSQAEDLRRESTLLSRLSLPRLSLPRRSLHTSLDAASSPRHEAIRKRSFVRVGKLPQSIYLHMIRQQQQEQEQGGQGGGEAPASRIYGRNQVLIAG